MPTSENAVLAKFAFWGFSEVGQEFIGNSSGIHRVFIATDYSELIVASKLGLGKPGREESACGSRTVGESVLPTGLKI